MRLSVDAVATDFFAQPASGILKSQAPGRELHDRFECVY